ncbi:MAG: isoquinoline 1-oxidoreductase [Acidobacteria bacterium]|nr:MAG: isoquinoline 1-oxidoreductase [Acidobacteriota bacterium]
MSALLNPSHGFNRRQFLKMVGGGIAVLVVGGPAELFAQDRRRMYPEDLNAYLRIGADGRVTVFSGKIEMGQGVLTSQAQMAAEELGVALESIDMVLGDTDLCPWDMGTFGSLTTRMFGPSLRAAAAEGRAVLLNLAAAKLGAAKTDLIVEDGVVSVQGSPDRKVTYAELAQGKKIARLIDEKAVLRSVAQFKVMGKSPRRLDGREKVTGAAHYAGDVRPQGLLYARILRPPAHGATLGTVDTAAAERRSGVKVVKLDDLVAVLHADPEAAGAALADVTAEWKTEPLALDPENIFDHLEKTATKAEEKDHRGDVEAARTAASRVFESTYRKGYVAHSPMEPHTAVAEPKDGRVTVWASTQTPFPLRDQIAQALKVDTQKVRVITPYLGGGFGGKSAGRQAIEAARLAAATGQPVQVAWTRAEEFFYDTFDPAAVVKVASAVDASGKIALWDYAVYAAGDRGAALFYDVPNARVRAFGDTSYREEAGPQSRPSLHPFATGPWRAPGARMNVFAVESQIDLMAAAAGVDPLEFRLRNTSDERMRKVLREAATAFGWPGPKAGSGRGRGIACGIDAGTYVALIVEIAVDAATGAIKVERVVAAQDMGIIVNPDGARMQMEGCVTMGLGYVLSEEVPFKGGEVLVRGFDVYHLPRFSALPKIETVLVKNDDVAPQGAGEPAIVPLGAAVANALSDATGKRLYRLPLTPERVKAALVS